MISNNDLICYADSYPDLKKAFGYNIYQLRNHWLRYGKREGRSLCNTTETPSNDVKNNINKKKLENYANLYEDVYNKYYDALTGKYDYDGIQKHMEKYAGKENRETNVKKIKNSDLRCYAERYPDLKKKYSDRFNNLNYDGLALHWTQSGKKEGRILSCKGIENTNISSENNYWLINKEIKDKRFGLKKLDVPSHNPNTRYTEMLFYLQNHKNNGSQPFIRFGIQLFFENPTPADLMEYKKRYNDLKYMSTNQLYNHWLTKGIKELRNPYKGNGDIKGGAICYVADLSDRELRDDKGNPFNYVNRWDQGRLLQMSYYSKLENPYCAWNTAGATPKPWPWNPVGGGDWKYNYGEIYILGVFPPPGMTLSTFSKSKFRLTDKTSKNGILYSDESLHDNIDTKLEKQLFKALRKSSRDIKKLQKKHNLSDNGSIMYVLSQPVHWACDNRKAKCFFEKIIFMDDDKREIGSYCKLLIGDEIEDELVGGGRVQECPAVYSNQYLKKFVYPSPNGEITRLKVGKEVTFDHKTGSWKPFFVPKCPGDPKGNHPNCADGIVPYLDYNKPWSAFVDENEKKGIGISCMNMENPVGCKQGRGCIAGGLVCGYYDVNRANPHFNGSKSDVTPSSGYFTPVLVLNIGENARKDLDQKNVYLFYTVVGDLETIKNTSEKLWENNTEKRIKNKNNKKKNRKNKN